MTLKFSLYHLYLSILSFTLLLGHHHLLGRQISAKRAGKHSADPTTISTRPPHPRRTRPGRAAPIHWAAGSKWEFKTFAFDIAFALLPWWNCVTELGTRRAGCTSVIWDRPRAFPQSHTPLLPLGVPFLTQTPAPSVHLWRRGLRRSARRTARLERGRGSHPWPVTRLTTSPVGPTSSEGAHNSVYPTSSPP
jgi:hypothetical protein